MGAKSRAAKSLMNEAFALPAGARVKDPVSQAFGSGAKGPLRPPTMRPGVAPTKGKMHAPGNVWMGDNPATTIGRGAPTALRAPGAKPRLDMPKPSGPSSKALLGARADGGAAAAAPGGSTWGTNPIWGAAAGGFVGGASSYATGGSFSQGAAAGAIGGAAFGSALKGGYLSGAARSGAMKLGQSTADGFSGGMIGAVKGMESKEYRRAAAAGGAALGGLMFGGNRSHKRGFNSRRGNSIGR